MDWLEHTLLPCFFLFDANKRIYWLYLLSSLVIAVVVSGKQVFSRNVLNQSSAVDVCWFFINQWLFKLLVVPLLVLQVSYILSVNNFLIELFGTGNFWRLNQSLLILVFTFTLFVCQDFCKFLVHFAFHKIPFLWRFHAVHHSATSMTPLTLYRIHPIEMSINSMRSLFVAVVISALFIYLFKNHLGIKQILGVNIFVFTFNLAASNLRHSHIYLGFSKLEYLFISPAQHQIHHSIEVQHYDKNFGSALAIWDHLFSSLQVSKGESVSAFGLDKKGINRHSIKQQWWGVKS